MQELGECSEIVVVVFLKELCILERYSKCITGIICREFLEPMEESLNNWMYSRTSEKKCEERLFRVELVKEIFVIF